MTRDRTARITAQHLQVVALLRRHRNITDVARLIGLPRERVRALVEYVELQLERRLFSRHRGSPDWLASETDWTAPAWETLRKLEAARE